MTEILQSVDVRASIVDNFRRDLIGPAPGVEDSDLATERLKENPSRWYLAGFLAPADDPLTQDGGKDSEVSSAIQDDADTEVTEPADDGAGGAAGDAELPDAPVAKRRFLPSSIGLTVLLPPDVREIEVRISWGDYRTEPPLPETILLPDEPKANNDDGGSKKKDRPMVDWVRLPKQQMVRIKIVDGRGPAVVVPESAAPQRTGGGPPRKPREGCGHDPLGAPKLGQRQPLAHAQSWPFPSASPGRTFGQLRPPQDSEGGTLKFARLRAVGGRPGTGLAFGAPQPPRGHTPAISISRSAPRLSFERPPWGFRLPARATRASRVA
jgi:hypothetical protein